MKNPNGDSGMLLRRMERYGSCMASVRWHIKEIIHLRREELGGLLLAITEGESNAESTIYYPRPTHPDSDHLKEEHFLSTYGRVNSVLHMGNPLKMEKKGALDRLTTAPAIDVKRVLTQANQMTETLM